MPQRVQSVAFRIVISFAMAFGFPLSPLGSSASHNPIALAAADVVRHAALDAPADTHDHTHDEGVVDEQSQGHSHGHNPADHTHETASAALDFAQPVFPIGRIWHAHPPSFANLESGSRLERPPKPVVIA